MEIPVVSTPLPARCPECGRVLSADAPAGLCPACLLRQGTSAESETGSGRPGFVPPTPAELAPLFPRLEILGLIGQGGMGAVYRARQPPLDRLVALKILPAGSLGAPDFAERFNREARALARLNHPNIVALHEFGFAGPAAPTASPGYHFFLMEHVEGVNLRQLQRSGRLSPREALQLVPQICDALQYAHDEGIVHRDIKPENVLVDRRGRVKIADFGLAKLLGPSTADPHLTREGQVMGTPHYMAPEQVERPAEVDHRADIYSLGVVFYELLTGELPLGKFPPPSRKVQVDVRLDEVVLRALEKEPDLRFQRAGEVKTRIETIASTVAASGRTAIPSVDPSSLASPSPSVTDWRAGLALALFLGGLLGTPLFIAVLSRDEWALIFGGLCLATALFFGALARRDRIGKGVVLATIGIVVLLGLALPVLVYGWIGRASAAREAELQARMKEQAAVEAYRLRALADDSGTRATEEPTSDTTPASSGTATPASIPDLDATIESLRRRGTTFQEAVNLLGEPEKYALGKRTFTRDQLPESFLACYPGGIELWVDQGRVKELRSLRPGPGFAIGGRLRVGTALSNVVEVVGAPAETVVGKTLPWTLSSGVPFRSSPGVLYRDVNGTPGFAYYDRADQGLRFFLKDDRVIALLVSVPD